MRQWRKLVQNVDFEKHPQFFATKPTSLAPEICWPASPWEWCRFHCLAAKETSRFPFCCRHHGHLGDSQIGQSSSCIKVSKGSTFMTSIYIQKNSKVSLVLVDSSVCGARKRFAPTHYLRLSKISWFPAHLLPCHSWWDQTAFNMQIIIQSKS